MHVKMTRSARCRDSFVTKLTGDILEPDLNLHKFRSGCKLSPGINTLYILYTWDQFRSGSNMSPIIISWQSANQLVPDSQTSFQKQVSIFTQLWSVLQHFDKFSVINCCGKIQSSLPELIDKYTIAMYACQTIIITL